MRRTVEDVIQTQINLSQRAHERAKLASAKATKAIAVAEQAALKAQAAVDDAYARLTRAKAALAAIRGVSIEELDAKPKAKRAPKPKAKPLIALPEAEPVPTTPVTDFLDNAVERDEVGYEAERTEGTGS